MIFLENDMVSNEDFNVLIQEAANESDDLLKTLIIDPLIEVFNTPKGRNDYIKYGDEFLEANSEMLAKEYPTKKVSFPRGYVDNVFKTCNTTAKEFKATLTQVLKAYDPTRNFSSITLTPTNVIHTIALYYSDIIQHRQLRDSARFQLGLTIYNTMYLRSFPTGIVDATMAYTYLELDQTWNLVKSENVINWIGMTTDSAYNFWKSKMDLNMSTGVLTQFLNRIRTSFRQNIVGLAERYYKDIENSNAVGSDVDNDEQYIESSAKTITLRKNLVRKISTGDQLYNRMGILYTGTAKLKNIKAEPLYEFAQKIDKSDIGMIIDTIFYVFLIKEKNNIDDINSIKYINRITNFPTAIDRAIQGHAIIIPMSRKYKVDQSIVKGFICLISTYIMYRINEVK